MPQVVYNERINTVNEFFVDYDYRFNNVDPAKYYPDGTGSYTLFSTWDHFYVRNLGSRVDDPSTTSLVSDGSGYRRSSGAVNTSTGTGNNKWKWAHWSGGNVVTVAGNAVWLRNFVSGDTTGNGYQWSWPSGNTFTPLRSNANANIGVDVYLKNM